MQMEAIESSLISHRGHNPENRTMYIRFATKTGVPGSLYEYGNISAHLYDEGCNYIHPKTGEISFGSWFGSVIKKDPDAFPYRKLEEIGGVPVQDDKTRMTTGDFAKGVLDASLATDFTSGQPLLATIEVAIPQDPEELKAAALELKSQAAAIVINSPEAYALAAKTGMAIARMRDALEKTFRPGIQEKHQAWKAELTILNHYDQPLEQDQNRLRSGMIAFSNEQRRKEQEEANRLRQIEQKKADDLAIQKAQELKLSDAIEAEERGEVELRDVILASPALPLAAAYVPPVHVPTSVPSVKGSSQRESWTFEITDLALIPREYFVLDEKAIRAVVRSLKGRTSIPGIRAYDEGNVSFSKK